MAKASSTIRAAWKAAERELAAFLGTTRAGIGFSGQDAREVVSFDEWMGKQSHFTRVMGEAKCDKSNATLLSFWHQYIRSVEKYARPLVVISDPKRPDEFFLMVRQEDVKAVISGLTEKDFWNYRVTDYRRANGYDRLLTYFDQVMGYAATWVANGHGDESVFPVIYLTYPNRTTPAYIFRHSRTVKHSVHMVADGYYGYGIAGYDESGAPQYGVMIG